MVAKGLNKITGVLVLKMYTREINKLQKDILSKGKDLSMLHDLHACGK